MKMDLQSICQSYKAPQHPVNLTTLTLAIKMELKINVRFLKKI